MMANFTKNDEQQALIKLMATDLDLADLDNDHASDAMINSTQNGLYIGIMSGTSMDSVDLALCQFADDGDNKITLVGVHSINFTPPLKHVLLALCHSNGVDLLDNTTIQSIFNNPPHPISELDFWGIASVAYADICAQGVEQLLQKTNKTAEDIIAIGVHGQTVRHRPQLGFSLQLLDPNYLCEKTQICVVSDFRRRDMAVGGQGAPLVPAFHRYIAPAQSVVLNLGGIANISVIDDNGVTGYDTGVANLLMDGWVRRHLGVEFDQDGQFAKSGQVDQLLLEALLQHPFLQQQAPKSTGREAFHLAWLDDILAKLPPISIQNVQATLAEFTAKTISDEIHKFPQKRLFVCGGGAYNAHLLERLAYYLPDVFIDSTDKLGIAPTWVEAVCFAWLARQNLLGIATNLPSVTGASKAVVLGSVVF